MKRYTLENLVNDPEFKEIANSIVAKNYSNPKMSSFFKKVGEKNKDFPNFAKNMETCSFKLQSVRYHFMRIQQLELDYTQKHKKLASLYSQKMGKIPGISKVYPFEVRIEFESFIMKTKSLLEIFFKIVSSEFKNIASRTIELNEVLKQHASKDHRAKLLLERLDRARWLLDFESTKPHDTMRDILTHIKTLPAYPQNLVCEKDRLKIMPSGVAHKGKNVEIITYASSIVSEIESLIEDVFRALYSI
jgi:hypothetical protein